MPFIGILIAALIISYAIYYFALSSRAWRDSLPVTTADLRRVSYLNSLQEADLEKLLPLVHEIRVGKGAWIIREHEGGDALYYVVSGEVDILKRGAVEQILVQKVTAGEFIGEMALLCGTKRVASARAVTPATLFKIARADFAEFLAMDRHIAESVWNACDVHSIQLTMTNDERLRGLSKEDRQAWLSRRECTFHKVGEALPFKEAAYICVVAGAVELEGQLFSCPAMIRVSSGQSVIFTADGRMAKLPL